LRKRRALIVKFDQQLENDSVFHLNEINRTVMQTQDANGNHILELPLDGSAFSDTDRTTLKGFIEDVWKTGTNQVEVSWKNSSDDSDLFKIFFSPNLSSVTFTQFQQRQVHLFDYNNNRTVAHEMGHVMGLDDHYYTLWNPDTCEYTTQINNDDLMSNQISGQVTTDEWSQLFDKYPASTLR
jgi:hypothetical protein